MKLGIKYKDLLIEKIPRELIKDSESFIINKIKSENKDLNPVICGSYRRAKTYSSDIDILITHSKSNDKNKLGKYMNQVVKSLDGIFIVDKLTQTSKVHFQGFASFANVPDLSDSSKYTYGGGIRNGNNSNPNPTTTNAIFDIKNNVIRLDIIIIFSAIIPVFMWHQHTLKKKIYQKYN